jgi:hypothetical protein
MVGIRPTTNHSGLSIGVFLLQHYNSGSWLENSTGRIILDFETYTNKQRIEKIRSTSYRLLSTVGKNQHNNVVDND